MLYRPNFCCHCGEKIARARWTPLTSRRFCDFCEIEQKQHDLLPRAVIAIAILFGAAGLTAYLGRSGETEGLRRGKPKVEIRELRSDPASKPSGRSSNIDYPINTRSAGDPAAPEATIAPAIVKQRDVRQNSSTQPVHHCGALTKKGTSCTRRVKTKVRCWQHAGQPRAEEVP
jgi:hypothetical protein